jgi:outer membrane protein TolC
LGLAPSAPLLHPFKGLIFKVCIYRAVAPPGLPGSFLRLLSFAFSRAIPVTAAVFAAALFAAPALAQAPSNAPPLPAAMANPSLATNPQQSQPQSQSGNPYNGSVVKERATAEVLQLSLGDAMARGLKYNLGFVLENAATLAAGGQRLQALQPLLPTLVGGARVSVAQTDLAAEGLRIPGFPRVIGPYGAVDFRGSLVMALINLPALENFLAAKHSFDAAKLSAEDAKDMVVLAVGNAYLTIIAEESAVTNAQAQVGSSKASLDQAVANHAAGTSPKLDEVRARVDWQTQQQNLIQQQAMLAKDRIVLARAIGLPLEQDYQLSDRMPYQDLDAITADDAVKQALANRKDMAAQRKQAQAAANVARGAHEERLPSVGATGDYGSTGINLSSLHGSGEAIGQANMPLFEEAKIRGDEHIAEAQKRQQQAELSNLEGQVSADVRNSLLDLDAATKSVAVARSNVELAGEELSEAQQRFAAGVSDTLAVVQAQATVAQANNQLVAGLYAHNVAKLTLARAMGVAQSQYQKFLGGK